jgi:hypothetical protein
MCRAILLIVIKTKTIIIDIALGNYKLKAIVIL